MDAAEWTGGSAALLSAHFLSSGGRTSPLVRPPSTSVRVEVVVEEPAVGSGQRGGVMEALLVVLISLGVLVLIGLALLVGLACFH